MARFIYYIPAAGGFSRKAVAEATHGCLPGNSPGDNMRKC